MKKVVFLLLAVGLLQMTGVVLGSTSLKGLGAASAASPSPKVFSSVNGLETFSSEFVLAWNDEDGDEHSLSITPEIYSQLKGPYNRRNVFGAAMAYGPVLSQSEETRPLFEAVSRYAFCGEAPLLREIGLNPEGMKGPIRVQVIPQPDTNPQGLALEMEVPCT